ncbi:MAG: chemotaxis protein CheW [Rhodospirillales bacterium]|nr:chemotaxis protein CheW [Rhodospirillales bacterium]
MSTIHKNQPRKRAAEVVDEPATELVTFSVEDQWFCIPVLKVQDMLVPERIAAIPMAPPSVRGAINLRGRIVTVIDVRVCLGLPPRLDDGPSMGVTVEHEHELYTLLVDRVGDVVSLPHSRWERSPVTLDPVWQDVARGVYRMDQGLMVVLDVDRLLGEKVRGEAAPVNAS